MNEIKFGDGMAGLFKIENTDLSDFVFKLHIFSGDYTNQLTSNMYNFSDKSCDDYVLIMNMNTIRIAPADKAYLDDVDINSVFRIYPHDTRTYMFHIDKRDNERAYGSVVMVDCGALSDDIDKNTVSFSNSIGPADIEKTSLHRESFFKQCLKEAKEITPNALIDTLNAMYMSEANYPSRDMIRVSYATTHYLMIHADSPVFKLTSREPQLITAMPADAREHEFAVKKDDRAVIEKMCNHRLGEMAAHKFYRLHDTVNINPEEKATASKPSLLGQLDVAKAIAVKINDGADRRAHNKTKTHKTEI